MRTVLFGIVGAALLLGGCASTDTSGPGNAMPDARDLTEHPLDVLSMPQP